MKFLVDECLSPTLAAIARERGNPQSTHVTWLGLRARQDWALVRRAATDGYVLVTNDRADFTPLMEREHRHPGLVCITVALGLTMARLLLDTTVIIDALRGRPAVLRVAGLRRMGTEPWTCAISVEKIWPGRCPGEEMSARRLFNGLRLASLGAAEGMRAGVWRRSHAMRGITLHQANCLVAAAAAGVGTALAMANVDDFPMSEIDVQHWPIGA